MLTPRENFLRYFRGEKYEWNPLYSDMKKICPQEIPCHISRGAVIQQEPFDEKDYGGKDLFGVEWFYQPETKGSMEVKPLLDDPDDIENWKELVRFPDLDAIDWEGIAERNKDYLNTDKILGTTIYSGFFERLISFIGFENAIIALVDEDLQDSIKALFSRLAECYIEIGKRMHRYCGVEWVEIHDDWGTQRAAMFSPEVHREMIAPFIKKVTTAFHKEGIFYEQHSCGRIEALIPSLIDSGCDIWRGQLIVDKEMLVNNYGDQFKFGVEIRPKAPVDDETAIAMAKETLEKYKGKNVWYIPHERTFTKEQYAVIEKMIHEAA